MSICNGLLFTLKIVNCGALKFDQTLFRGRCLNGVCAHMYVRTSKGWTSRISVCS